MLAYQNQDIKILENSFLTISIEIAENTLCFNSNYYLCLDLLSWWVTERTVRDAPTKREPSVPLHPYYSLLYFMLYSIIGSSLFTSVAKMIPFCSSTDMP